MEKTYQVNLTQYALEQISEIKEYIICELFAPQAAKKLLLKMKEAVESLERLPMRNPLVSDKKWRKQGIRRIVVENFYMYYWINEEREIVYITAVVYGKREQSGQLDKMDFLMPESIKEIPDSSNK